MQAATWWAQALPASTCGISNQETCIGVSSVLPHPSVSGSNVPPVMGRAAEVEGAALLLPRASACCTSQVHARLRPPAACARARARPRCSADCGWVTGHTYLTYGPMLNGVTQASALDSLRFTC